MLKYWLGNEKQEVQKVQEILLTCFKSEDICSHGLTPHDDAHLSDARKVARNSSPHSLTLTRNRSGQFGGRKLPRGFRIVLRGFLLLQCTACPKETNVTHTGCSNAPVLLDTDM